MNTYFIKMEPQGHVEPSGLAMCNPQLYNSIYINSLLGIIILYDIKLYYVHCWEILCIAKGTPLGTLDRKSFDGTDREIAKHVAGTAAENNWDEKCAIICLAHDGNSPRGTTYCTTCVSIQSIVL